MLPNSSRFLAVMALAASCFVAQAQLSPEAEAKIAAATQKVLVDSGVP